MNNQNKTGKVYVQYGCGLSAPKEWKNYDASLPLRIQKIPVLGTIMLKKYYTLFPSNVIYGDIIKGLPIPDNSCDGLYCSHVLEHLSLDDFRTALKNSYKVLKKDGIFRCLVPDLEFAIKKYIRQLEEGDKKASIDFMHETYLGTVNIPRGLKGIFIRLFGYSQHLWMWDQYSLHEELKNNGFKQIRTCKYNDCDDKMFQLVEEGGRFTKGIAFECRK